MTGRMKIVYIAGPYTGAAWQMHQNIEAAKRIGRLVALRGAMPLIPHSNTPAQFTSIQNPEFWLEGTMELMRRADAVVFMRGWRKSEGTKQERAEAERLGMPIFGEGHVESGEFEVWVRGET